MYKINGVEYDEYSVANQRICETLVNREVFCCMTSEVEYMLSRVYEDDEENPFSSSVYDNMVGEVCEACGCPTSFTEINIEELPEEMFSKVSGLLADAEENGEELVLYKCDSCGEIYTEEEIGMLDCDVPEIFEWWAVTDWFGEKLKEEGCTVIDSVWGKSYWGRTTTGQSISIDGCITNIAKKMGILEGMEYDWSKHF